MKFGIVLALRQGNLISNRYMLFVVDAESQVVTNNISAPD